MRRTCTVLRIVYVGDDGKREGAVFVQTVK